MSGDGGIFGGLAGCPGPGPEPGLIRLANFPPEALGIGTDQIQFRRGGSGAGKGDDGDLMAGFEARRKQALSLAMKLNTEIRLRRRCDLAVANSASVSQDLRAIFSSRPPVQVIHNGLDIARFQPQGPTAGLDAAAGLPPLAPAVPRLGLVATFARWKGHAVFMQALAQIQDLPWRAYIIGAPVYQTLGSQYSIAELRQRAEALKLTDRIGFTGACADMPAVYRALDIVIHASTQPEPFGMTILEAMACARPVIVSYAGGAAELIQPGVDALAFPPGQSQALAERLRCLLGDSELRRRLGREARNSGERRFALDRMTEHFIQAYAQLAPPRARAAGA